MVCWSRPYPFNFLKAVFHKYYLAYSWVLHPIYQFSGLVTENNRTQIFETFLFFFGGSCLKSLALIESSVAWNRCNYLKRYGRRINSLILQAIFLSERLFHEFIYVLMKFIALRVSSIRYLFNLNRSFRPGSWCAHLCFIPLTFPPGLRISAKVFLLF